MERRKAYNPIRYTRLSYNTVQYISTMATTTTTTTTTAARPADVLTLSPSVSGDVPAELIFYAAPLDGSDPFNYIGPPPPGVAQSNLSTDTRTVTIHDLRGKEASFSLDRQAFLPLTVPAPPETDFLSDDSITSTYYPAVEALLRDNLPGIRQVYIFDHTVRRGGESARRGPVLRVHIDQTPASAVDRVSLHLGESVAAEVLAKDARARIVNVWRPLNRPVESHPLALADSMSVVEDDLVSVAHIYPERVGATGGVKFAEQQKWWYWSGQTPDEVMLIKCFDSDTVVGGGEEGRRGRTPHTAFIHPHTPEDAPPRESIEVRCLVIS